MASNPNTLFVTFVDVDRNLLKIWGQKNRIGASYIERQLSHLATEFNRTPSLNPSRIRKGMLCYAKHSDDYYRARVISNVQGDSVGVLFVDFGNRNLVHVSNIKIRESSEDVLLKMAEQAEEYYLARVIAPAGGWAKEIISEIRHAICYEELVCNEIFQVGDQKLLEIQFQSEDFSSFLIKKQFAQEVPLNIQSHMILSYCSLVPSNPKQNSSLEEMLKTNFSVPPQHLGRPISSKSSVQDNPAKDLQKQCNFPKISNPTNFSQTSLSNYHSSGQTNPSVHNANKTSPSDAYYNSMRSSFMNENPVQTTKPPFNSLLYNQYNPVFQMKGKPEQLLDCYNNAMIAALAQQIKQYIAEGNAKSSEEKIPHNYVNSVLEVGSTHNVFISCIDDGPWSFSIQLVSCEEELNKLMKELTSAELVPIKPPIVLGHPCICASGLYDNLCRGVIVSISHSAVKVYFVDFGDTEDLPVSSIYELPQRFFKTRVLSQKFCLSGLQKVTYSNEIKMYFKEVVQDELLMLQVTSLEGDNLPTCELYLKEKNIKRILNEKIRNNRGPLNDSNPDVGDTENVVVTWVDSLQKFYVQLHKRDSKLNALKDELSEIDKNGQKFTFDELRFGLKCICKYNCDGQWYRAMITSVISEKQITVVYVDYGNTETVDISLLRKFSHSGLINEMNNQAIQCCLQGFEFKSYDQNLSDLFENLTLEKNLKMTVVSVNRGQLCVKLFDNDEDIVPTMMKLYYQRIEPHRNDDNDWKEQNYSAQNQQINQSIPFEKTTFDKTDVFEKNNSKSSRSEKNRRACDGNWREEKRKSGEGDVPDLHRGDKFNIRKQDKENRDQQWTDRKPITLNEKFTRNDRKPKFNDEKFSGSRGFKKTTEKKVFKPSREFDERKKLDDTREVKGKLTQNANYGVDLVGKRFEKGSKTWKDSSENGDLEIKKKVSDRGDKSEKKHKRFEESRKLRHAMKKEDVAPPGSGFIDRVVDIGSSEKAIITYYVNPHEFYVQLLSNEEEFKKMMHDIQMYYSDKYSLRGRLQVNDIVIAQFSYDNILYRGEVVKSVPLIVHYVDYGNQEEIGQMRAWSVAKQFLNLPKQVVKCRLANVQPIGSEWLPLGSKLDAFFEAEEYQCTFLSCEDGIYEVKMEALNSGKDVASEIISSGCGMPKRPKFDFPQIDFSLLPTQILRLYVTHVESPSKFFVSLNPEAIKLIEQEIKVFTENKEFLLPLDDSSLKPKTSCLATYDDLLWYRGTILNVNNGQISVWLSDRGDTVNVTANQVKSLPQNLYSVQSQAVECYLNDESKSISVETFKAAINNKHILVSIISETNERLSVVLYDQKGNKLDFQTNDCHSQTVGPIGQVPITSQKLPVFISHVVSPNEIYIQRKIDLEKAKILSQKLQDFYKEGAEHAKFEEKEGQLVAVKSVNSQTWYRGRVMGLLQDAVDVFYIDLGKRETLPHENVKNLDASFHDINSFVRKVCLDINCDFGALENVNAKLEALKHIELLGYFINDKGNFLSEFVLEGNRITPTLKFDNLDASNDKFEKILRVSKPLENETLKGLMRENEVENQSSCSLKVFVIHIDSPKQFWVHKESSVNDLSLFQEELKKACETLPNKQNPEIHDMVAALFCDMWYRAEVLNVENNMLTVKFIDYGNILEIDLSCESVKELPADFVGVPTFATKFSLKGNWKESATAKFEEIVFQFEDPVTAVILENKDPLVVDLLKDGQSIFETLIREGVGEINESKESDFCTVYLTHSNSPNDFYVQRDSSTDLLEKISGILSEVDTLEVVSTIEDNKIYAAKFLEYDSWFRAKVLRKNQKYVEVLFIDYGNVANVNELRRLPNELLEIPALGENYSLIYGKNCDNWSEEACEKFLEYVDGQELKMKVVVNRVQKPIVKLFSGETDISEELGNLCENDGRIEVYVSHVNSPTDFYIQHVNDDKFKLITKALESGSECEDLEERTPGTLCLAGFAGDGLWYRAKILRNCDDGCEVLFIDCGKTLISTELKKPLHDILEIPPRAMKCTLDLHVRNVPESVKEEFTNLTASGDKIFRARIITPGEVNVVSLKLDGRILEETLSSDSINEETENGFSASLNHPDLSSSLDDETDDDKNSKKTIIPENYVRENIEDDVRARSCLQNETDEEKRFKIAISTADGGSEGFKSDDEKGISTEVLSSFVNATDIELMEEFQKIEELSQVELNLPVESNGVANEVNQNSTDEFFESSKATETSESIAENSRKESNEEEEEEEEEKGKSTDEESKDKPIEQSDVSNVSESIDSAESPQKTASAEERPSDEYSEVKQSVPPVPADND